MYFTIVSTSDALSFRDTLSLNIGARDTWELRKCLVVFNYKKSS